MCSLSEYKVNFGRDFNIVESFDKFRMDVETKLKDFHFPGHLAQIGSCWDGSKIGRVNEMDCLYVIDHSPVDIEITDTIGEYKVFSRGEELKPRTINVQFADYLEPIINTVQLPANIQHSGYAGPFFSGVRFNGPAVTSLFEYKPEQGKSFQISLDLTLAFPADPDNPNFRDLCRIVQRKVALVARESVSKQIAMYQVHIVPNPVKEVWQLSTAYLEANILRDIPEEGAVNIALHNCKALVHKLETLNPELRLLQLPTDSPVEQMERRIMHDIMVYHTMENSNKGDRSRLNELMRYEHIYLPPGKRKQVGEISKSAISINSAAVKHIILAKAFSMPNSFCEASAVTSEEMMREVFMELSNTSSVSVQHSFLGTPISKFSVLPALANVKDEMALTVQRECQQLLHEAMTEV